MSKWLWFYDLVERKLGDVLEQHQFKKLTGKAYEEDENKDWTACLFYTSDADVGIVFDLLFYDRSGFLPFYVVRVFVGRYALKAWLYPNIDAETGDVDLWHGWKCSTQDDVEKAFDEIAVGLKQYLDQPQE